MNLLGNCTKNIVPFLTLVMKLFKEFSENWLDDLKFQYQPKLPSIYYMYLKGNDYTKEPP